MIEKYALHKDIVEQELPRLDPGKLTNAMVALANRPQCFTSNVTGQIYCVQLAWRCLLDTPRMPEIFDVQFGKEDFLSADIDQQYALDIAGDALDLPAVAFQCNSPTGQPLLHIIDGWHRCWRWAHDGRKFAYVFLLTPQEADYIMFTSREECAYYQIESVRRDPSLLEHDARRIARQTGWKESAVLRVCQAIYFGEGTEEAERIMQTEGIPLEEFLQVISS